MTEPTYYSFKELCGEIDAEVGGKVSEIFQREYKSQISAAITTASLLVTVILAQATGEDGGLNAEDAKFNLEQIITFLREFTDEFIKDSETPRGLLS